MKQKIEIMKTRPGITDDEIRSYMDFDQLLVMHKDGAARKPHSFRVLWVASAILLLGTATLLVFFNMDHTQEGEKIEDEKVLIAPAVKDSPQRQNGDINSHVDSTAGKIVQKRETMTSNKEKSKNTLSAKQLKIESRPTVETNLKDDTLVKPVYAQAEPVQGYPALYAYFNAELRYPQQAMKDSIRGEVIAVFTINTLGVSEKISIEQSLGPLFDQEVLRLITSMPAWKPATYGGKPVASKMSLPLTFQLRKIKK